MTTTFRGKNSGFLIISENTKKDALAMAEESEEEEIEIDIEHVTETIKEGGSRLFHDTDIFYENGWSTNKHIYSNPSISNGDDVVKKTESVDKSGINGTDGNNDNNGEECDSDEDEDEDEVTKEDVEAIYEQLNGDNAILKEQIIKLKFELAQTQSLSIIERRSNLKKEIEQIMCQKREYSESNKGLKSWCFDEISKRFHNRVSKNVDTICKSLKKDSEYTVQTKLLLDSSQDPGSKFRSSKYTQTIRTMAFKGIDKTEKIKNDRVSQLKKRHQDLANKLTQVESQHFALPTAGPSLMLIKRDDYLRLLNSVKGSKSHRTKTNNCDRTNKISKAETAKTKNKPLQIPTKITEAKKELANETNGESKRQFYICKCGQKFSKNALGYKAAYDSFRQHVARCSVYMKNGAVCDICDAPFHSIPCLKVHIRRIHPERPELLEKYRHIVSCPCGKVFDNYSQECTAIKALRKHARACQAYRSKAIFCNICKEPFLEPNQLNNHIRMAHSMKTNGVVVKSSIVSKASTSNAAKKKKVA